LASGSPKVHVKRPTEPLKEVVEEKRVQVVHVEQEDLTGNGPTPDSCRARYKTSTPLRLK